MKGFCEIYFLVISALWFTSVTADPKTRVATSSSSSSSGTPNHDKEVEYEFRYAVDDPHSGVVSSQWEHRVGEFVRGFYSLVEPDGKVRHVDYEVDGPRGFHAVIRTNPPANNLLSQKQLEKSQQSAKPPPVNVLTNRPVKVAQRTGRVLPINFHKIKPDYYLAFAKGTPPGYEIDPTALEAPDAEPVSASATIEQQNIPVVRVTAPSPNLHHVHHDSHKHDKSKEEYVLPSVEGVTYFRSNNGRFGVATGSSVSNIRTYNGALPGDISIPRIPSRDILPPTDIGSNYPLHTHVIYEPYSSDYLGG